MIAGVHGTLLESSLTDVIVEASGVCYRVNIPRCTFENLPKIGSEIRLFTEMTVREDDISLYGFLSKRELQVFNLLRQVNGIGAKTALGILSSMNIPMFFQAVLSEDRTALKRLDGVGPKSADRIIVELRDKVRALSPESQYAKAAAASDSQIGDALSALEKLGFSRAKIEPSVVEVAKALPEKERSTENIIRKALQSLNRK